MRKSLLTIWMILLIVVANGQGKEKGLKLYTEPGSKISYLSKIEKVDSLWHWQLFHRSDGSLYQAGYYKDKTHNIPHGKVYKYHFNKALHEVAEYANGVKEGVTFCFDLMGRLTDSIYYQNGKIKGIAYKWHTNGMIADSAHFDGNGNGTIISWDENGMLRAAGYYVNDTSKQGRWKYYHPNGIVHAIEDYKDGAVTSVSCFNDKGEPLKDCSSIEAAYKGGAYEWARFVQRNLNANVPIDNRAPKGYYTVIIQFVVGLDGSLSEFKPLTNHGYGMEEEVMRILKSSGPWEPAQMFGVNVKAFRRQPVTFIISEQ